MRLVQSLLSVVLLEIARAQRGNTYDPFTLPLGGKPISIPAGTNPFLPANPATHTFGSEFDFNDGSDTDIDLGLKFPIIREKQGVSYPWNLDFDFTVGTEDLGYRYGHVVHPTNKALQIPYNQFWYCLFAEGGCGGSGNRATGLNDESSQPIKTTAVKNPWINDDDLTSLLQGTENDDRALSAAAKPVNLLNSAAKPVVAVQKSNANVGLFDKEFLRKVKKIRNRS